MPRIRGSIKDEDLSEYDHHCIFVDWANNDPFLSEALIHIENERKCTLRQGVIRRRLGVKKGVSDFYVPLPTWKHHGLWMELKRIKGYRISDEQTKFIENMASLGYRAVFVFGYEQAIQTTKAHIAEYYEGKRWDDKHKDCICDCGMNHHGSVYTK